MTTSHAATNTPRGAGLALKYPTSGAFDRQAASNSVTGANAKLVHGWLSRDAGKDY
jgi:hypothetical protein